MVLYMLLVISVLVASTNGVMFTKSQEADIERFVEKVMKCRHVPGLTLSVVKGKETWTKGFGSADITTGRPVDENTLFMIGSVGKAFTAALIEVLLEENGYNWNTRLIDLKGVNLKFNSDELTREITIADVLSHRTGLSSVADYGFISGYPKGVNKEFLSRRTKYIPQQGPFRSSFIFNNMMYMVLGHVTRTMSAYSWEDLLDIKILEPIGMTSTAALLSDCDVLFGNVAKPYILKDGKLQNGTYGIYSLTPLEPSMKLRSNAADMAKWMRFNLKSGVTDNGEIILDTNRYAEVFKIHNPLPVQGMGYGYGWFSSDYRGHRRSWHSGGLYSFVSLVWLFHDEDIGIFASINGPAKPIGPMDGLKSIFSFISDILLNEQIWFTSELACSLNVTRHEQVEHVRYKVRNAADFAGRFGHELLPDINIVREVNKKMAAEELKVQWTRVKGELLPGDDKDAFIFKMTEPWEYCIERMYNVNYNATYPIVFIRDKRDNVIAFNITFNTNMTVVFRKDIQFLSYKGKVGDTASKGTENSCWTTLVLPAFLSLIVIMKEIFD